MQIISNIVTSYISPSHCAFPSETCSSHRGPLTFNGGVEVGIFVQLFHLLAPVKLIPPVIHHLPQVGGVEAILEGSSFHVRCEAELIQASVQILWKEALLARLASSWHVSCARAATDRLLWHLYCSLGHHKPSWRGAIFYHDRLNCLYEEYNFLQVISSPWAPRSTGSYSWLAANSRVFGAWSLAVLLARRIRISPWAPGCLLGVRFDPFLF